MKKIYRSFTVTGLVLALASGVTSAEVEASVLGDNYPSQWKTGYGADTWGMYYRQCTSFVAFRLSSANGFRLPSGYGNAITWGSVARSQGYQVNMTPAVGSVAWFGNGVNGAGAYGHVSWVAEVNGDMVTVEEYNFDAGQGPEKYYRRTFRKSKVSGYIHFKDLSQASSGTSTTPVTQTPVSSTTTLPSSGRYQFTSRSDIKNQPQQTALTVAYYDAGQSVYYDKTVVSEGYLWISYIGASGTRRYIAIQKTNQVTTTPVATTPVAATPVAATPSILVGDRVSIKGTFRVSSANYTYFTSSSLAGSSAIDPGPVTETNTSGQVSGDQILYAGDYFTIPGKYQVLSVNRSNQTAALQIGSRTTWVNLTYLVK